MSITEILVELEALGSPSNLEGMARFGILTSKAFGIPTPVIKNYAKELKKRADDRHQLALGLWKTGNYEARAVAFLIDDPKQVTREQMNAWAMDFDNWATVDGACGYLFRRTHYAYDLAVEWAGKDGEFTKRAGFSLIAYLAVHDKRALDEKLAAFLPLIEKHSDDARNFVKKAVNWALRQIGKRSLRLNVLAIEAASRIKQQDSRSARWIAADALRELTGDAVRQRLEARQAKSDIS
ncbi:MAG: DNA alkylation repair protein [Pyrinomonadaceae bacterium]